MVDQRSLAQNRNFLLVWFASVFGVHALAIAALGETWYGVKALGAEQQLGLIMIAEYVPRVFLMLLGGVAADRVRPSRIMFVSLLTRLLLIFLLVGLLGIGRLNIGFLIGFAFLYGSLDAFFWPASDALLRCIVEDDSLLKASSIM